MNSPLTSLAAAACQASLNHFRPHRLSGLSAEDIRTARISFSQQGEDLVVYDYLCRAVKGPGIYIDAGCFDPILYSNTRLFYLLGWRGICVDASLESIERFREIRPGDVAVAAALGEGDRPMVYCEHPVKALSCLLPADQVIAGAGWTHTRPVTTQRLTDIIQSSRFASAKVHFLSVDLEGHDLEILQSYPFFTHRPCTVCVEAGEEERGRVIREYLEDLGYRQIAARHPSYIYADEHWA